MADIWAGMRELERRLEVVEGALKPKENLAGLAKPKPVTRGYNEADDSYTLGYEDYLQLNKELDFTSLVRGDGGEW